MDPTGSIVLPDSFPFGLVAPESLRSIDDVVQRFPHHRWKIQEVPGVPHGGRMAFAIIGGNKETGELHVFAALEHMPAPEHEHLSGGVYGETVVTFAGELDDVDGDGKRVLLGPGGGWLTHRPGSIHTPRPGPSGFWFGYYHQPRGSRLITP